MIDLLERLLPLWTQPVDSRDDAVATFRTVYADPVVVNGTEMTVEAPGRVVVSDDLGLLRQLDAAKLA